MNRKAILPLLFLILIFPESCKPGSDRQTTCSITQNELEDKIQGGLLGQILGNLNGLPHEFKYFNEPGHVEDYVPSLPYGARTDDDTDIEWVHICYMQKYDTLLLSPEQIVEAWKKNMNRKVYASSYYARQLMDIGIVPPYTGYRVFNPFAHFNLAGSFLSEAYGLISPGMPQTASTIGSHYTSIQVEGEPLQTTQLITSMIAIAFFTGDIEKIVKNGLDAVDRNSELYKALVNVLVWHEESPDDYARTREKIKNHFYTTGFPEDINDVAYNVSITNTACVIAGLLYGKGDFVNTLQIIFNLGWDADCNAATAGTILGVIKGREWMEGHGWEINNRYYNATRDEMPDDETITSYGNRLVSLAEKTILENGGERQETGGDITYIIPSEPVINILKTGQQEYRIEKIRKDLEVEMNRDLTDDQGGNEQWARAAYYAISLELAGKIKSEYPEEWARAVTALDHYPRLLYAMLYPKYPMGYRIHDLALEAGIDMVEIAPSLTGNVEFILDIDDPEVERIAVYGNFNNYSKFETLFGREGNKWVCRVNLAKGKYNYLFLVTRRDGTQTWLTDPNNPEKGRYIDGYFYSFLEVNE